MKNLISVFNLLLFPFLLLRNFMFPFFSSENKLTISRLFRHNTTNPYSVFSRLLLITGISMVFASSGWGDTNNNDSCNNAEAVTLPYSTTGGSMKSNDRYDYYSFTPTSSGTVTITVSNSSRDLDAYLYNSNCNTELDNDESGSDNPSLTYNVTAGTTYKLLLYDYENKNTNYSLEISAPFIPVSSTVWVPNGTLTSAELAPTPYTNNADDTETLTIPGAAQLDVTITGTLENDSSCKWDYVTVTDSAGTTSQKYCGTINNTYTAVGPTVTLTFHSDGSVVGIGAKVTIRATAAANNPPTANPQSVSTYTDTPIAITLTGTDPEGQTLTYTIVNNPSHGVLTGTAPNVTYVPTSGFTGTDSFTFRVYDGTQDSAEATVSITVNDIVTHDNADDLCYETPTYDGLLCLDVLSGTVQAGVGCTPTIPIRNQSTEELSIVQTAIGLTDLATVNTLTDCGIDGSSGAGGLLGGLLGGSNPDCGQDTLVDLGPLAGVELFDSRGWFNMPDYTTHDIHSIYYMPLVNVALFTGDNLYAEYIKNGEQYRGPIKACSVPSYCEAKGLSEGFHKIDPDGGSINNTFEIFCHEDSDGWHDLIAMPIKNDSNNFVFDNNTTVSNYYNTGTNPRTHFQAIEVALNLATYSSGVPKIPVIVSSDAAPWDITTDGNSYKVLGSTFSNINLIATPFTIDWDNTSLSDCDTTKLRKALNQAVKYNTLSDDDKSICKINNMTLSLQPDYRYLVYAGNEVLQPSCKLMAEAIPDNVGIISDSEVEGYFNIDPFNHGRGYNRTDIGSKERPITVYCSYQTDLKWVWTFLTALDAKVTVSKNDLVAKQDTCSELGLYFFVPSSAETFNRVRTYLKNHKTGDDGWEGYTGTIEEKISSFYPGNVYYLSAFKDVLIWPYGPFGVYFPSNGNTGGDWGDGAYSARGTMSGSMMHNIPTGANYTDSLGFKGWVSILGEQDLNKTNDWWIADFGAGEEIGVTSTLHPKQSAGYTYYEPNGNYIANAWLNFLYDTEGNVYHNDDWDNNYPYYDYLCMAEDNYDTTSRYSLVPGFFNIIEHNTKTGNTSPNFYDYGLTTQIVSKDINFDVLLYDYDAVTGVIDTNTLEADDNKSVGLFLSTLSDTGNIQLLQYLGTYKDFAGYNGRIPITAFSSSTAQKEMFIHFYYCNPAGMDWTQCWTYNNNTSMPVVTSNGSLGGSSDSYDKFAIRPKAFDIDTHGIGVFKAGQPYPIDFNALNFNGTDSLNYNENENSSFRITSSLNPDPGGCVNLSIDRNSSVMFQDGFHDGDANRSYLNTVGDFNLTIAESVGSEFAIVDQKDTSDLARLISEATINLHIVPDAFDMVPTLKDAHNTDANFTYLNQISALQNKMAATLNIDIKAVIADGSTAENYKSDCYADSTALRIDYNLSAITPTTPTSLTLLQYYDRNNSTISVPVEGNITLPTPTSAKHNIITTISYPNTLFRSDTNGSANIELAVNFDRKRNLPVNPFTFTVNDVNLTETDSEVSSKKDMNKKANYYYARVKASKDFYEDVIGSSVLTPISVLVYCDLWTGCTALGVDTVFGQTDESYWWLSTGHNEARGDGNITLISPPSITEGTGAPTVDTDVTVITNGQDPTITVTSGATSLPMTVEINLDTTGTTNTNPWVIYNPNDPIVDPSPFYKVRFIDTAGWSGVGNTGHVVDVNASSKKTKRLNW